MSNPVKTSIQDVLSGLGATWQADLPPESLNVSSLCFDSRDVHPGSAFFCLPGEHVDGNTFIGDAIARGASCVITQTAHDDPALPQIIVPDVRLALALVSASFYGNPSQRLRLIGVTGTNGKTTTTHLIERIMTDAGKKTGLIGTLGTRSVSGADYAEAKHTTPQSSDLQRILSAMADSGCSHVAMEVSSHALALKRVAGCHFAAAVLSNITQDHLDFHKTMDNYWRAKAILFEELNESIQPSRLAVLNSDDPLSSQFARLLASSIRKITYGWSQPADIHVKAARFESGGSQLTLATPAGDLDLSLKLTGRFNVYNTMAAVAVALAEGVQPDGLKTSLENFSGVPGRFEVVSTGARQEPLCIVDYAHTPDGLDNVLKAAANVVPEGGKLIVVFGCGGDRDASKRPQMGEIAESRAHEVIVTSDNPRSEDPQQIISNILAGIKRMRHVKVEPDRQRAITLAVLNADARDVVVVAGKGHENYQILSDRVIAFDDRLELLQALKERLATGGDKNSPESLKNERTSPEKSPQVS